MNAAALLEEACARNVPLEIHRRSPNGSVPCARGRMIWLDENNIYIEQPQTIGREVRLAPNQHVDAFFSLHGEIYGFPSIMFDTDCTIRLNTAKTIRGMSLVRPAELRPGQRRSHYRVSLACQDPIPAIMHATAEETVDAAPWPYQPFSGTIVDASAGGFGVIISHAHARPLEIYDPLFIHFQVPGGTEPLLFLCEIRQIRPLRADLDDKLGLMIVTWPDQRAMTRSIQPLLRMITDIERKSRSPRS
ncbi:MAG: PilZ domain-containing protein [Planctomycetota bacterium]|nr:PilZ domain-containing protein [Planctomycetota bacterium]